MNAREEVTRIQSEILENLIAWEVEISYLYKQYAGIFRENQAFWEHIAGEEESHAALLKSLKNLLKSGSVFWNIGQFLPDKVAKELAIVRKSRERFVLNPPTENEALEIAFRIESSLLEAKFYTTVTNDASEFKKVADVLTKATENHAQKVRDMLMNSRPPRLPEDGKGGRR